MDGAGRHLWRSCVSRAGFEFQSGHEISGYPVQSTQRRSLARRGVAVFTFPGLPLPSIGGPSFLGLPCLSLAQHTQGRLSLLLVGRSTLGAGLGLSQLGVDAVGGAWGYGG